MTDEQVIQAARKATIELLSFLDVSFPRGRRYANSLETTMAIVIEQNIRKERDK
jgi:hypothetical protein